MRARRRGVLLIELLVAALLLGGAAVACVSLSHACARRAQSTRDHAVARMVAVDLATILMDEPVDVVASAARPGAAGRAVLRQLWSAVSGSVPRSAERALARVQVTAFAQVLPGRAGESGLYRLTLDVRDRGLSEKVSVLFRPSARKAPRPHPPKDTPFFLPRS